MHCYLFFNFPFVLIFQLQNLIQIFMHRRQQTDYTNSKVNYQVSSPYIQLLQSKKKVFGHKYQNKNNRSYTGNVKPSPASGTSIFASNYKPFKSVSSQKSRINKSQNTKKKRNHTEQIEQKMHESLFIHMNEKQKPQYPASKSLFYGEPNQQPKQSYLQFLGQTGKKKTRKRYLSENKQLGSDIFLQKTTNSLENLKITDIDSLIALIDNCVLEANEYISYLSQKIQCLKQQLILSKTSQNELEQILKSKEEHLKKKQYYIMELERQIERNRGKKHEQIPFQVKNLLQVIQKMNDENSELKKRLQIYEKDREIPYEKEREKERGKDFYNEIHSNIDILNISIGGKKHESPPRSKDLAKKYKFIKPKQK